MLHPHVRAAIGIVIGALYSLVYAGLFPMLTGSSVIYWYPYWPASLAIAYIAGGILIQASFCYVRGTTTGRPGLVAQTLIGAVYLVAAMMVSGGPYMS
jgi:hypothetical protein